MRSAVLDLDALPGRSIVKLAPHAMMSAALVTRSGRPPEVAARNSISKPALSECARGATVPYLRRRERSRFWDDLAVSQWRTALRCAFAGVVRPCSLLCVVGESKERSERLETFWDWFTVFCFAGLVTLLLQRSAEDTPRDKLWQYGPAGVGLAVINYVGNEEIHWLAALLTLAVAAYVLLVLKPQIRKS